MYTEKSRVIKATKRQRSVSSGKAVQARWKRSEGFLKKTVMNCKASENTQQHSGNKYRN